MKVSRVCISAPGNSTRPTRLKVWPWTTTPVAWQACIQQVVFLIWLSMQFNRKRFKFCEAEKFQRGISRNYRFKLSWSCQCGHFEGRSRCQALFCLAWLFATFCIAGKMLFSQGSKTVFQTLFRVISWCQALFWLA